MNPVPVTLQVNGRPAQALVEPRATLADLLRSELGLTGTHVGCEQGVCGACTVLVDGAAVRSCLVFAVQVGGAEVRTVEGLAPSGRPADGGDPPLHPLQEAFWREQALQCGFCTAGFLMTAVAAIREATDEGEELDRHGWRERLSGNLCRCTGYESIVDAVVAAAEEGTA